MISANFWPVLYKDLLLPNRHMSGIKTALIFYGPFTLSLTKLGFGRNLRIK